MKALFQMVPTKALGPNGFPALFYQQFWDIVKGSIMDAYLQVLNQGASVRQFNQTHIVLIPKIKQPREVTDYRPISLCMYITKTIANRLKRILFEIIPPYQGVFVPERLISDNILVSYEFINHILQSRKGKKGLVVVKLNMSKTYDHIEWKFLHCIRSRLGFGER